LKARRTPTRSKPRPTAQNQWWGIGMTKVMVEPLGWVYVVIVLGRHTKKIVGHHVGLQAKTSQWLAALDSAVQHQFPQGSRDHGLHLMTDNGCQPASVAFMKRCAMLGITQAFTSGNNPKGNADTERLMWTLKEELLWLREWTSPCQVEQQHLSHITQFVAARQTGSTTPCGNLSGRRRPPPDSIHAPIDKTSCRKTRSERQCGVMMITAAGLSVSCEGSVMTRVRLIFPFFLSLTACGVVLPYLYDAQKLDDRLSISMPKEQVVKRLGRPDRIVQEDGAVVLWEYRLYPKGEWLGYLVHCPFHLNCYFPAETSAPYYLALRQDRLCLWGTPSVVRTLAWRVCGGAIAPSSNLYRGGLRRNVGVSVIPVFMPPPITAPVHRLAVISLGGPAEEHLASWLDLTLAFLRSRHPQLMLVEREALRTVLEEINRQYAGRFNDETAVRVGRLVGADSLLAYRIVPSADRNGVVSSSLELRLLQVESGATLFRQVTTATVSLSPSTVTASRLSVSDSLAEHLAVEEAAAYGFAALAAAFGDNPLGIIPDRTWTHGGLKVLGLLQGGPASRAGLQEGDRILAHDGRALTSWTEPISIPAILSVERDGYRLDIRVEG
jgi:hypothetical protein